MSPSSCQKYSNPAVENALPFQAGRTAAAAFLKQRGTVRQVVHHCGACFGRQP